MRSPQADTRFSNRRPDKRVASGEIEMASNNLRRVPWTCEWGRVGKQADPRTVAYQGYGFWFCEHPERGRTPGLLRPHGCEACPSWEPRMRAGNERVQDQVREQEGSQMPQGPRMHSTVTTQYAWCPRCRHNCRKDVKSAYTSYWWWCEACSFAWKAELGPESARGSKP